MTRIWIVGLALPGSMFVLGLLVGWWRRRDR